MTLELASELLLNGIRNITAAEKRRDDRHKIVERRILSGAGDTVFEDIAA